MAPLFASEPAGAWPALRAALIAGVLAVEAIDAMPLPELDTGDLRYAVAQEEIEGWRDTLAAVGIERTTDELTDAALRAGALSTGFRRAVLGPFKPFFQLTGTGQAWGLFAYPDPYAGALTVEGKATGGEWELLWQAPDSGGGRLGRALRNRRVRGIWDTSDRPRPGVIYRRFCDWLADRVFFERPDLDMVRITLPIVHIDVPPTGEPPTPGKPRHLQTRVRPGPVDPR